MTIRIVVAIALFCAVAAIAWWLERRGRADAPSQATLAMPEQLDRADFEHPDTPWLVVLFTSSACASCEGLFEKATPLASAEVAVVELEYPSARAIHERYHIRAAPMTLIADREGVVRASFTGAFTVTDLWNALAELRA